MYMQIGSWFLIWYDRKDQAITVFAVPKTKKGKEYSSVKNLPQNQKLFTQVHQTKLLTQNHACASSLKFLILSASSSNQTRLPPCIAIACHFPPILLFYLPSFDVCHSQLHFRLPLRNIPSSFTFKPHFEILSSFLNVPIHSSVIYKLFSTIIIHAFHGPTCTDKDNRMWNKS